MTPDVAMMMWGTVKSEAGSFGRDTRKYADSVRKAGETCHKDIAKAMDKHERTLDKIGRIEGVDGDKPTFQLRHSEETELKVLRSSTEPAVIFA